MSDPNDPRYDWTRPADQPDDLARDAAQASGADLGRRRPDTWAEVYRRPAVPEPREERRSLRAVAWVVSVLIPLMAVMDVFEAWDYFTRAPAVLSPGQFHYGLSFGSFYPAGQDPRHAVSSVVFAATAALFITWQYKHAKNAQRLNQLGGIGPGWAIGGWFIPLAHLVMPAVQLVQASAASDPVDRYGTRTSRTGLVVLWAVIFHLSTLQVTLLSPDTVEASDTLNGVLGLLAVPAAILAVVMIWQLTKRQETALDAHGL